jgi:hypothetical protein
MNGEGLIPCRKENGGGVLKIESELPQLLLDIRKQRKFFFMITKMDKPLSTSIWPVECSSQAPVFCCPPNRRKCWPMLLSTLGDLSPHHCCLYLVPCLHHDQGYQQGQ